MFFHKGLSLSNFIFMQIFESIDFISLIDHLGTFAFAISGIRLATVTKFDWFGAYIIGLVTAIGGGTTRDLLLGVTPFWMQHPSYLVITGFAIIMVVLFEKRIIKMHITLFLFDAIGLGLFTIVGIEKTLQANFPMWVAILMGMITGSVGGVIRDVLLNEKPLIFRKDIYALACMFGGIVFFLCRKIDIFASYADIIGVVTVIAIRILAMKFHISIPTFKPRNKDLI